MKVAFATSTGIRVDRSFQKADGFAIWDITPTEAFYVTTAFIRKQLLFHEDQLVKRIEAISNCALICAPEIKIPAQAKLAAHNIHVLKIRNETAVEEIIGQLQQVLMNKPAPWMYKSRGCNLRSSLE